MVVLNKFDLTINNAFNYVPKNKKIPSIISFFNTYFKKIEFKFKIKNKWNHKSTDQGQAKIDVIYFFKKTNILGNKKNIFHFRVHK